MAELATIARPYAEALYKAVQLSDAQSVATQLNELVQVTADPALRGFAARPDVTPQQVLKVLHGATRTELGAPVMNLLGAVLDNGRLEALPEIAAQFSALNNTRWGISDALIESAYPIDEDTLPGVVETLEKRFGRRLKARVALVPELIGGIRVVVGDEVLDTSVKARLEHMKAALTA